MQYSMYVWGEHTWQIASNMSSKLCRERKLRYLENGIAALTKHRESKNDCCRCAKIEVSMAYVVSLRKAEILQQRAIKQTQNTKFIALTRRFLAILVASQKFAN